MQLIIVLLLVWLLLSVMQDQHRWIHITARAELKCCSWDNGWRVHGWKCASWSHLRLLTAGSWPSCLQLSSLSQHCTAVPHHSYLPTEAAKGWEMRKTFQKRLMENDGYRLVKITETCGSTEGPDSSWVKMFCKDFSSYSLPFKNRVPFSYFFLLATSNIHQSMHTEAVILLKMNRYFLILVLYIDRFIANSYFLLLHSVYMMKNTFHGSQFSLSW